MSDNAQNSPNAELRLESWKEIAAYLQRDVSTVIRWEKSEHLPVYRHQHLSRSSVYAYPSELEAWRANRKPAAEAKHSTWWRPIPAFASTIAIALTLMMAGSGPHVGALVQAADGIVTRQVWTGAFNFDGTPSPDGRYLAFDDETGNLAMRDLTTGLDPPADQQRRGLAVRRDRSVLPGRQAGGLRMAEPAGRMRASGRGPGRFTGAGPVSGRETRDWACGLVTGRKVHPGTAKP